MNYIPGPHGDWESIEPTEAGLDREKLALATNFALGAETHWPRDLSEANNVPGLTDIEPPPWNKPLGIFKPRGSPNGVVVKGGKLLTYWGDPERVDMTFSIAKSYLSVLAGLAVKDGLITDLDAPVGDSVPGPHFAGDHNGRISWRHMLQMNSEWRGEIFGKDDQVDHYRQIGPGADNSRKGQLRKVGPPGSHYEYNDVRVNALAYALLMRFGRPLPEVLRARIMDPIGASDDWRWEGYSTSWIEMAGRRVQSVTGGGHWGGGSCSPRWAYLFVQNPGFASRAASWRPTSETGFGSADEVESHLRGLVGLCEYGDTGLYEDVVLGHPGGLGCDIDIADARVCSAEVFA